MGTTNPFTSYVIIIYFVMKLYRSLTASKKLFNRNEIEESIVNTEYRNIHDKNFI